MSTLAPNDKEKDSLLPKQETDLNPKPQSKIVFWKHFFRLLPKLHGSPRLLSWKGSLYPIILMLGIVIFNLWAGRMYGKVRGKFSRALLDYDIKMFYAALQFGIIHVSIFALTRVALLMTQELIAVVCRYYLVSTLHTQYVTDISGHESNMLYKMNHLDTRIPNPDQRIVSDANQLSILWAEVYSKTLEAPIQIVYYWGWTWQLLGWPAPFLILGFYVVIFIVTQFAMKTMMKSVFKQEKLEGDFRYAHVRLRTLAESVTLHQGADRERGHVQSLFGRVTKNRFVIILKGLVLEAISMVASFNSKIVAYGILGYYVFSTKHFEHAATPGKMVQMISDAIYAASTLANGFANILKMVARYSQFAGYVSRLGDFTQGVNELKECYNTPLYTGDHQPPAVIDTFTHLPALFHENQSLATTTTQTPTQTTSLADHVDQLSVHNLNVYTPMNERLLIQDLNFTLAPQESLLIVGPSGCGKSTLLRTLAKIWPYAKGTLLRPSSERLFFLPQTPYLTLGSLRDQLAYPDPGESLEDSEAKRVLDLVHLSENWLVRLDEIPSEGDWAQVMSPGEQQLVALARLLHHAPPWAIFDESTSALPVSLERELYHTILTHRITPISIGHRPSLAPFHYWMLNLGMHDSRTQWAFTRNPEHREMTTAVERRRRKGRRSFDTSASDEE
eukprot:gnl/Trimastix_PCT/841.p1 GENE.gnl/Trimastix_PCT/841~~gnl/Trimastix_PCT/841.p1  ORF type:complete len:674 (+),score=152.83 gnl/Trimastix_PCT/841:97-2118(+)